MAEGIAGRTGRKALSVLQRSREGVPIAADRRVSQEVVDKTEATPGNAKTKERESPPNWEYRQFGALYAEPSRNGMYKSAEFHGRGTRIVNMGEMFGFDFISDQDMSRVLLTAKEIAAAGLQDGDLLFGRRSVVPAGAGKVALVVGLNEALTFESSIIRVRLEQEQQVLSCTITSSRPRLVVH